MNSPVTETTSFGFSATLIPNLLRTEGDLSLYEERPLIFVGASLFDVQKLLEHQDIAMTQRYAHLSDAGLKKASGFVATMLDQAAP